MVLVLTLYHADFSVDLHLRIHCDRRIVLYARRSSILGIRLTSGSNTYVLWGLGQENQLLVRRMGPPDQILCSTQLE